MYTVPDWRAATLLPIIQGSIRPGTTIMPDMLAAYGDIQAMGYAHLTVNHTYEFVDPITGAHTQNVENSWKNAKQSNKKRNGTHRSMLDSYLCEWMWRQRSRNIDLGSTHKVQVNPGRSLLDWAMKPFALRRLGHHIV